MTRMLFTLLSALLLFSTWALPLPARADVLLIEEVRQSERMNLPANGMTRAEVKSGFGEPQKSHGAVGTPPITRWDYDGWSVYFEYDRVLFTVLHKGHVLDKSES